MHYHLSHQLRIAATSELVFTALTSPAGLNSWWTLEASGKPELGAAYRWFFDPAHDWRATVDHVIPGSELTWRVTEAMDDWVGTTVGFELENVDGGCVVRFFHRGWPHDGDHFSVSNYSWGQLLHGLKDYAERGVVIPFNERA